MVARRKLAGSIGIAVMLSLAACQQILGLDQPTVSISAIGRICECVPLLQQGPTFAGDEEAACETALAEQPKELLLAVAENDCTDCANVTPCYALLTGAGDEGEACATSSNCASWACCQGVLSVGLSLDNGELRPRLESDPPEPSCCAGCMPCGDAFAQLNVGSVVACTEAEAPLLALLECLLKNGIGDCQCQAGSAAECLACLQDKAASEGKCDSEFQACEADPARPIPVPE